MPERCPECGAELKGPINLCPKCGANARALIAEARCEFLEGCMAGWRKHYFSGKKYEVFVKHIQEHLGDGESVVCKICNKTFEEITDGCDEQ